MLVSVLISPCHGAHRGLRAAYCPSALCPARCAYRDLYRDSPLGVVAVTVSGMVASTVFSMGPVYARLSGLGNSGSPLSWPSASWLGRAHSYPVGRLSDRMDRRTVIAGSVPSRLLVAVSHRRLSGLPHGVFLALAAIFSGLVLTLYSLAVSHVNDQLEPAQMVAASSALLLFERHRCGDRSVAGRQPDRGLRAAGLLCHAGHTDWRADLL